MKSHVFAAASLLTLLMAGCASTPTQAPAPIENATKPAPVVAQAQVNTTETKPMTKAVPAYLDPANALYQQRSVYFDFDKYDIKDEYKPVVQLHGQYLAQHSDVNVRIEGNADERGSREYNLALGQKRAQAVSAGLASYGVKASQVEAVSYGSERPKANGHNEAAWSQNRRADVVYK